MSVYAGNRIRNRELLLQQGFDMQGSYGSITEADRRGHRHAVNDPAYDYKILNEGVRDKYDSQYSLYIRPRTFGVARRGF